MSNTKKLREFIETIPTRKVPEKVNQPYLVKAGYKSTGDRPIIKVLKFAGFLNDQGGPTEFYSGYLDSLKQKGIMAAAVKQAYSDLFAMYDDACSKDNEALVNFFRTESGLGQQAVQYMVATFKVLCDLADFDKIDVSTSQIKQTSIRKDGQLIQHTLTTERGMTVNLNIQLTLPATEDATIYDAFFKSMRKHLLKSGKKDD